MRLVFLSALVLPLATALTAWTVDAQDVTRPAPTPPAVATRALERSLSASAAHKKHLWRDTRPINPDGTVNAYIEIARGDRQKWEFDMAAHERRIDRMIAAEIGGYPVNYGFVPQTVSYDGDPFDALVLGPPLPGGHLVAGVIVGVMFMEDEKGVDSKVVLSRLDGNRRPMHHLTADTQQEIAGFFNRYKQHEPGAFSRAPGWGSAAVGLAFVTTTH